jgi:hypothetical protein
VLPLRLEPPFEVLGEPVHGDGALRSPAVPLGDEVDGVERVRCPHLLLPKLNQPAERHRSVRSPAHVHALHAETVNTAAAKTVHSTVNTTFDKTFTAQNRGVERSVARALRQRVLRVEQPLPLAARMVQLAEANLHVQGLPGAGLRGTDWHSLILAH